LTHQLLAFARQEVIRPEVLSLNDVVGRLEDLLGRSLGEHITLRYELADDLAPVMADRGQLERVVVNLAVNARDAMPRGGTLVIDTAVVEVDEEYATSRPPLRPGRWVRLRVSDNGDGMDPETLRQAFDPFFSTKATGQGTGLGLATIHGIVSQAGGYCQLYSEPGQGTTFSALLPATDEAPANLSNEHKVSPGGGETVLVVEDEAAIREVARRVLAAHGYRVLLAEGGVAALAIIEREPGAIDLVVSDLVMPTMSGRDLAGRVTTRRPGMRFVFMSGYASNILDSLDASDQAVRLIEKPFSGQQLLAAVRDALDEPDITVEEST
jgi:CheY-like chemotaxis protein